VERDKLSKSESVAEALPQLPWKQKRMDLIFFILFIKLHNQPLKHNFTCHMLFLQGLIQFDQGISEKSSGQKCVEEE
jgi:hypothetical protein